MGIKDGKLCPVALFAYNRYSHLERTVSALLENPEARDTELYIFCDGAHSIEHQNNVDRVRQYAKSIKGFKALTIIERNENFGLSRSITSGVSQLCAEYGQVAVLEDDILVTRYFLGWINAALNKYRSNETVFSVGCYVPVTKYKLPETFFLSIPDCWGWAVWERSWKYYEANSSQLLENIIRSRLQFKFDLDGAYPYTKMLKSQILGLNDSWAIRWYASSLLSGGLTIYPEGSITSNIGFDSSGTHCQSSRDFDVPLMDKSPVLMDIPIVESKIGREAWHQFYMSTKMSIIDKIKNFLNTKFIRFNKWIG